MAAKAIGTLLARVEFPADGYSRSRGRNGWFTPRMMEAHLHRHRDGTPLITLRQCSRRAPEGVDAPAQWTLPLEIYHEFSRQVNGTASKVLTNRRGRIVKTPKARLSRDNAIDRSHTSLLT